MRFAVLAAGLISSVALGQIAPNVVTVGTPSRPVWVTGTVSIQGGTISTGDGGLNVTATNPSVQDAGGTFNGAVTVTGGKAANGIATTILTDDAGAVVLSNPGISGGTVSISGIPQVYFDGGTVGITGKATNGNPFPVLLDDAGAIVISNPGAGGGGGTSANVQDAGLPFNRAGSNTLGVATNGVSFPILTDDAGAIVISNPGAGGGSSITGPVTVTNGDAGSLTVTVQTPLQVYFDGGTVNAVITNTPVPVMGIVAVTNGDAGSLPVTITGTPIAQVFGDGGLFIIGGATASGNPPTTNPVLIAGIAGVNVQPFRVSNDGSIVVALRTGTSPQVPTVASFAVNTSTEVTPLPAGGCIYITCNREVWYVTGVTPITAVVNTTTHFPTDKADITMCLASTETDIAFVTDDVRGGTCSVSILNSP